MFGILLAGVGSFFQELSDSVGKKQVGDGNESYYTFGFLSFFAGTIFLIVVGFVRDDFVFTLASLPTFIPRVVLEIVQAQVSIWAIVKADRSTFGTIRTLTIPLLLAVDLVLGYTLNPYQLLGMSIIFVAIFLLLSSQGFKAKGLFLCLFTAVNAVATLSLFKYNITHFNSVESEAVIILLVLMLYFFLMATIAKQENPLRFLRRPAFLLQSGSSGAAVCVSSFAYAFAPASVIVTAVRAFGVLFSLLSGKFYFKEEKFLFKILLFMGIVVGLILLLQ